MKQLELLTEVYIKTEAEIRDCHDSLKEGALKYKRMFIKGLIINRCDSGINVDYCEEYTNYELDEIADLSRAYGESVNEVVHLCNLYQKSSEIHKQMYWEELCKMLELSSNLGNRLNKLLR